LKKGVRQGKRGGQVVQRGGRSVCGDGARKVGAVREALGRGKIGGLSRLDAGRTTN